MRNVRGTRRREKNREFGWIGGNKNPWPSARSTVHKHITADYTNLHGSKEYQQISMPIRDYLRDPRFTN
jgi:hypothetical protein